MTCTGFVTPHARRPWIMKRSRSLVRYPERFVIDRRGTLLSGSAPERGLSPAVSRNGGGGGDDGDGRVRSHSLRHRRNPRRGGASSCGAYSSHRQDRRRGASDASCALPLRHGDSRGVRHGGAWRGIHRGACGDGLCAYVRFRICGDACADVPRRKRGACETSCDDSLRDRQPCCGGFFLRGSFRDACDGASNWKSGNGASCGVRPCENS